MKPFFVQYGGLIAHVNRTLCAGSFYRGNMADRYEWPLLSLSLSRFDTDGSKKGEEEGKKLELDGKKRCSSYSSIYRAPDN